MRPAGGGNPRRRVYAQISGGWHIMRHRAGSGQAIGGAAARFLPMARKRMPAARQSRAAAARRRRKSDGRPAGLRSRVESCALVAGGRPQMHTSRPSGFSCHASASGIDFGRAIEEDDIVGRRRPASRPSAGRRRPRPSAPTAASAALRLRASSASSSSAITLRPGGEHGRGITGAASHIEHAVATPEHRAAWMSLASTIGLSSARPLAIGMSLSR